VAKVIEFYRPSAFRKCTQWIPAQQRGKLLEFCRKKKKTRDVAPGLNGTLT
jgi:hypothetical protein